MWYKDYQDDETERYSVKYQDVPDYKAMENNWVSVSIEPTDNVGILSIRYITGTGKKRTTKGWFSEGKFYSNHNVLNATEWCEIIYKRIEKEY